MSNLQHLLTSRRMLSLAFMALACINIQAAPALQAGGSPASAKASAPASRLDCATTVYSLPGVRFMHKVRPVDPKATVTVVNLPQGLSWNAARRIVDGVVKDEGVYTYNAVIEAGGKRTTERITLTVDKNLQMPRPFMGWLSWNSVQDEVSEAIVRQVADLFVDKGLYDCGWNAIMLDDLWQASSRADDGSPQPNAERFPNGMKAAADYVHGKNMKFGIYTDAADKTCAGAFGTYRYEKKDAGQYAKWGVDIVKCDYCNAPEEADTAKARYRAVAEAFRDCGRNIALYICEWGYRQPWKWGAEAGGVCWRVSDDVRDCWSGSGNGVGVVQSIKAMKGIANWQGVNRWNDADMLCTGLHGTGKSSNDLCATGPGMTQDEYRTQFALWCMWSSPMALSFDPRSSALTDDDLGILRNKELIALNQDRMGQQGDVVYDDGTMIVFAKDCENGDVALSFTNLGDKGLSFMLDIDRASHFDSRAVYSCRDLWAHKNVEDVRGSLSVVVGAHATRVFRLAKK